MIDTCTGPWVQSPALNIHTKKVTLIIAAKSVPFPLILSDLSSQTHTKFADEHLKAQAIYFGTLGLYTH